MKVKNTLRIVLGSFLFLLLAFVSWQVFMSPINSKALTMEEAEQVAIDRYAGEVIDKKLDDDLYEILLKLDTGEYQIKISRDSGKILDTVQIKKETARKELTEEEIKRTIGEKEIGEIEKISKSEEKNGMIYEAIVRNEQQKIYLTLDGGTGEIIKRQEEQLKAPKDITDSSNSKENNQEKTNSTEKVVPQNITYEEAVKIALDTVYGEVDDVDFEYENGQYYYFVEIELDDDREAEIQIHAMTGEVISIEWDD